MSEPDIHWKQDNTLPTAPFTLRDAVGPIELTTAVGVTFKMWAPGAAVLTVNAAATVVDAASGKVSYTPVAADTATPGLYLAEFVIDWGGGQTQDVPNGGHLHALITQSL